MTTWRWVAEHSAGYHHAEMDHPEYYRVNRYAAAIVAHNYNPDRAPSAALARSYGLEFEAPDVRSWYFPNNTWLAVYIEPRGAARVARATTPDPVEGEIDALA